MAIFDDPKKDLEQLEKQLIAEEEWFRQELDSAKLMLGDKPAPKKKPASAQSSAQVRNYANGYESTPKPKAKSEAPKKPVPQKAASKKAAPPAEKPRSNRGLIILAACETLGIVGIVAYWLLFIFG